MKTLIFSASLSVTASAVKTSGFETVINMLTEMDKKGREDKLREKHTYDNMMIEFAKVIASRETNLKHAKQNREDELSRQQSAEARAGASKQTQQEAEQEEQASRAELTKAVAEKDDRLDVLTNLLGSSQDDCNAVTNAHKQISNFMGKGGMSDTMNLMQVKESLKSLPTTDVSALMNFLNSKPPTQSLISQSAPQSKKYSYEASAATNKIIAMVQELKTDLCDKAAQLQTEIQNLKNNFALEKNALDNAISAAVDKRQRAKGNVAKHQKAAQEAEQAVAELDQRIKNLSSSLSTAKSDKHLATSNFENNQKKRADEIQALQQAVAILNKKMGGSAFLQKGVSFVQTKSSIISKHQESSLAVLLKEKAKQYPSLLGIAQLAKAGAAFDKIINMIKKLRQDLMETQRKEATKESACRSEKAKLGQATSDNNDKIEQLQSDADKLRSVQVREQKTRGEFKKEIAETDEEMAVSANLRAENKDDHAKTIADSTECIAATTEAMEILSKVFVSDNSFLQTSKGKEIPVYGGMGDQATGPIAQIEIIQSDCRESKSSTESTERSQEQAYDKFIAESKKAQIANKKASHEADRKAAEAAFSLSERNSELQVTNGVGDQLKLQTEEHKKSCVVKKISYEERVRLRNQEIEGLKSVLEIVEGLAA